MKRTGVCLFGLAALAAGAVAATGATALAATGATALAPERPFRVVGLAAGSDCHTVAEAIAAVPADNATEKIILLQPGAFFGHTVLDKPHVTLRGSGPDSVLTYNFGQAMPGANGEPVTWRGASTLLVTPAGHDVLIENLTLENTYGQGMQAQALSVEADRVALRRCRILGWQDTIRLESGRQWFDHCYISGHVDFIYGAATAWFDHCEIFCRGPGYIVAPATLAGRIGFVFADCRVTFTFGNPPVYLGRPWHESPSATFVRCELGAGIRPEGWHEWNVKPPLVRFAEYQSTGPGAGNASAPVTEPAAGAAANPAGVGAASAPAPGAASAPAPGAASAAALGATRVPWAVHSAGPPPPEFDRAAVLGDWVPAP